jgi:6,7-dimethyl-8-ribityllumazine synthase
LSSRTPRRWKAPFSPSEQEGSLDARGRRFGIVVSRWNATVTEPLLASALETLERLGAREPDVRIVRVPGAFELPAAAKALIGSRRRPLDAVIVLGAIVRGETTHHEVLGHAVAAALSCLSADTGVPVGFGLLTCDTMEQARARSGKGAEAAEAAVSMANLRRGLRRR